jgi:methylmalonyl-CoA mutase C-terminal domain/subunit
MTQKQTRVLISKLGLDGHDRGAKLVAHALKEAGMEVFYQGIRHTVNEVVDKAVQENVRFLGLSFLAGDHMTMVPKVIEALRQKQAGNIRVFVGGIILKEQIPALQALGVQQVFLPGTPLADIVKYVRDSAAP